MSEALDLPFRLETWTADDVRPDELLALCTNAIIGQAAFTAAVAMYPTRRIYLRHGARIVARHPCE